MPTRKSDGRRSDVSVARFVLADEENDNSAMVAEPPAPEPAEPSVSGSTPAAQSQTADKRDKEKNKERESDNLTIEDLTLPKSIITRLAKGVLPPNTQIQANAILALTKGATVFINHLANAANEFTVSSNKKTIMPADVFKALDDIEYGFMREKLEAEFAKFNEIQTSKRSTYRKKVAAAKKGTATAGTGADTDAAAQSQSGLTADTSMMSIGSAADTTDRSLLPPPQQQQQQHSTSSDVRAAKKARMDPAAGKMEVDGDDEREMSDAETVPDEQQEEDEDEDDEVEEDEEEEEEEEDDDEEGGGGGAAAADGERDDLEERTARDDGDEALDDDSD
ncbi:histone-fold-containing protein [Trichocladium antarcticum]|uniref:DNA polymerase epsilon subunit D n=1 Tax=Trichocladium antarcticum TaxID=1450529 RepID=A0AAN6UH94_9PEZI|nr:histone-fold-containing protein [Trichocladium antarcticum]